MALILMPESSIFVVEEEIFFNSVKLFTLKMKPQKLMLKTELQFQT